MHMRTSEWLGKFVVFLGKPIKIELGCGGNRLNHILQGVPVHAV